MNKETYQKVSDILLEAELITEGFDMGTAQRVISKLQEFDGLTPRQLIPKVKKMKSILRPVIPAFSKLPKLQKSFNLRFRTFIKQEFNMNIATFENSRIRIEHLLKERGILSKKHPYNFSRFFTLWICHRIKKMNPDVPLSPSSIIKEARIEIRTISRMVMAKTIKYSPETGPKPKPKSPTEVLVGEIIKKLPPKTQLQLTMAGILWVCITYLLKVVAPKIGLHPKATFGIALIFILVSVYIVFVMLNDTIDELLDKEQPKETEA